MGSELSGAGSGAAAGSAFGPWGAAIGGAVGLIGGMESANKASDYEQQQQNALNADQAARQKYIEQQQATFQPIQQQLAQEAAKLFTVGDKEFTPTSIMAEAKNG